MSAIEDIKKNIDLVEYIGKYVSLKKTGQNFQALCPFHSEKTPSFIVSPQRQIWHCFGACNEGGDIIAFVMKWENVSFGEALSILAPIAGVKLEKNIVKDEQWSAKKRMYRINALCADFFHYLLLNHPIGKKAQEYIKKRGVSQLLIKQFHIGYSPKSWDSLYKFLKNKKISNTEMLKIGLVSQGKNKRLYDRFRGRIIFPLTDMRGNVLGFSGRIIDSNERQAKYINTPETPIYHKRETLFGIYQAKNSILERKEAILMEGEFDVLLSHKHGFTNSIAIKGSAVTIEQLKLLKKITNTITFALDMDEAGISAVQRGIQHAQSMNLSLYVMHMHGAKDPADIFQSNPIIFKKQYRAKQSIYEFLVSVNVKKYDTGSIYGKKKIIDLLIPVIASIHNPIVKDYIIKLTAQKTNTDISVIKESLDIHKKAGKTAIQIKAQLPEQKSKRPGIELMQEYLLALVVRSSDPVKTVKKIRSILKQSDFSIPAIGKIINAIEKKLKRTHKLGNSDKFLEQHLRPMYNKAFLIKTPADKQRLKKDVLKISLTIKKFSLKRQIKQSENEEKNSSSLFSELSAVEKELAMM